VYHDPVPGVKDWDDLGIAEVDCALDVGAVQCLARLRAEACRLGGDLLYDVPKKPLRPTEQGMTYRGHVARKRVEAQPAAGADDDDGARAADKNVSASEQSTGPIEPLVLPTRPAPPPAPFDGGARGDGAATLK
jgi:hypothetical protein